MPIDPISLGLGAATTAVGLINSGKAKKEAAELARTRPKAKKSPFIGDQLSLAESELAQGMSADAENAYQQGMDRDLSSSLDAILKGGGSVNNVAEVFDRSAQGRQRLALMEDNLRLNQINNLAAARSASENERQQLFEFNEWMPWADKAQANAQARQQAQGQIWGGIGTAASSLMRGFGGNSGQKQLDNYFNYNPEATQNNPMARSSFSTIPMTTGYKKPDVGFINPNYASSLFGNEGYADASYYESEQY